VKIAFRIVDTPGKRPIQPLPRPEQSKAPARTISRPANTKNFPISFMAFQNYQKQAEFHQKTLFDQAY
jgi:hypothetical protein